MKMGVMKSRMEVEMYGVEQVQLETQWLEGDMAESKTQQVQEEVAGETARHSHREEEGEEAAEAEAKGPEEVPEVLKIA